MRMRLMMAKPGCRSRPVGGVCEFGEEGGIGLLPRNWNFMMHALRNVMGSPSGFRSRSLLQVSRLATLLLLLSSSSHAATVYNMGVGRSPNTYVEIANAGVWDDSSGGFAAKPSPTSTFADFFTSGNWVRWEGVTISGTSPANAFLAVESRTNRTLPQQFQVEFFDADGTFSNLLGTASSYRMRHVSFGANDYRYAVLDSFGLGDGTYEISWIDGNNGDAMLLSTIIVPAQFGGGWGGTFTESAPSADFLIPEGFGALRIGNASTSGNGVNHLDYFELTATAIPEPSGLIVVLSGALALIASRRRRMKGWGGARR